MGGSLWRLRQLPYSAEKSGIARWSQCPAKLLWSFFFLSRPIDWWRKRRVLYTVPRRTKGDEVKNYGTSGCDFIPGGSWTFCWSISRSSKYSLFLNSTPCSGWICDRLFFFLLSTAIFVLTFLRHYIYYLWISYRSIIMIEWFESYHLPHSPHKKKNKRKNSCFVKSRIREKALIAECRIEYSWVVIYFFFLKRPSAEIPKQVKFIYNS